MATKSNSVAVKLCRGDRRRFNIARKWMQVNRWNYSNAQSLAQDASTKYDVPVKDLLPAAQKLFLPEKNGLFTRSEKRRTRKKIVHKIKGAARAGFSRLFGIPLSPGLGGRATSSRRSGRAGAAAHPSSSSGSAVRSDVISALTNQGYKKGDAVRMASKVQSGDSFSDAWRRVMARNPGELVIFGNPQHVFTRAGITRAKRAGNPIPAAILEGLEWTAGSKAFDAVTSGKSSHHRGHRETQRKSKGKKRNPNLLGKAKELFQTFHHRGESGVYESQRSAKIRKDYTILGPLVAIGVAADQYEDAKARIIHFYGREAWFGGPTAIPGLGLAANHDGYAVEKWDKLPHMAFLTGAQVNHLKKMLSDPELYVRDCPQLASSPNARQLYALTPDPPDPEFIRQFDTDEKKDYVDLGEATFVVYIAKKPVDPLEWVHTLGEEGGTRPRLNYNRLAKEIFFSGGSYTVQGPGIMN